MDWGNTSYQTIGGGDKFAYIIRNTKLCDELRDLFYVNDEHSWILKLVMSEKPGFQSENPDYIDFIAIADVKKGVYVSLGDAGKDLESFNHWFKHPSEYPDADPY